MEQSKAALLNYATTGLVEATAVAAFQSDASLQTACKKALQFYKELAAQRLALVTNFILASDNFKKTKKAFEAKSNAQRTQADVDAYNKAVAEMNKLSNAFNKLNNELNGDRTAVVNGWNKTVTTFMDVHIPFAK